MELFSRCKLDDLFDSEVASLKADPKGENRVFVVRQDIYDGDLEGAYKCFERQHRGYRINSIYRNGVYTFSISKRTFY